ncbi:hypothetical protein A0J61_06796 [Choanephora cucurbitarum]|uniref:Uncharacterized protein n=1 Tax=Choanephora cucurbitarum TaxID=101091 RepID=A0A1C7N7N8_9FUNG|nr:hypothetical protein A0J61_06796 [Choanephora cucurbitarum]
MNKVDTDAFSRISIEENKSNINRMKCARNWHKLSKFQDLIHCIDFADLRNQDDILYNKKLLWEMSGGCYEENNPTIFSPSSPFPQDQFYVYVYAPEYVDILNKMKKNLKRMQDMIWMQEIGDYVANSKEMVDEFYDDVATLKRMVHDQVQVYDKDKFEETFRVDWRML